MITICDVGPRDGLQNEQDVLPPETRAELVNRLARTGLPRIEAVSFVRVGTLDNPDAMPPDIHIFTQSKQPWVLLPPGVPAVAEYYRNSAHWPAESLARIKATWASRSGRRTTRPLPDAERIAASAASSSAATTGRRM